MDRRRFIKTFLLSSGGFLLGFFLGDRHKSAYQLETEDERVNAVLNKQVIVSDFGAIGDGANESAKVQAAIDYAYDNDIPDVFFPAPQKKYNLSNIDEKGRNLLYNGNYFKGDWRPQTLSDLEQTEGFDKDKYEFVQTFSQKVKDSTKRWWSLIATVFVPKGEGIGQDNAAIRGQAVTNQEQSRIWGGVLLAQANHASAPSDKDKQKLPSVIGLEVDVNNQTGVDIDDLEWSEVMGVLIASGGTSQVGQALTFSKLPKAKGFWVGTLLKDDSVDFAGTLIDDVQTKYGMYYTKSYLDNKDGGTVISLPSSDNNNNPRKRTILEIRTDDDNNIKLRYDGDTTFFDLGKGGLHITRDGSKQVMASFNETGEFFAEKIRYSRSTKNLSNIPSGQTYLDAFQGEFLQINNTTNTRIKEIRNGETGQELVVHVKDNRTTFIHSNKILLAAGENFSPKSNTIITFIFDGNIWLEKNRSENSK